MHRPILLFKASYLDNYTNNTCSILRIVDAPDAPLDLKVTDTTDVTANLEWNPPEKDGGNEIKGYEIEWKPLRSSK